MANQKTLTNWLLSHRDTLDLRVQECSWIATVFPGWHDLDVSVTIAGQRYSGRGSSPDEDTALCKAFCEAVERFVCHSHGIRSHGVAGHFSPEEAKKNAKFEYIERRSLVHQVETQSELLALPVPTQIQKYYSAQGIKIALYNINTVSEASVVLCLANGLEYKVQFGGILGLGAHSESKQATDKALIECLRNAAAFLQEPVPSLSLFEFKKLTNPTGLQKQALLRDPAYFRDVMVAFTQDRQSTPNIATGDYEELEIFDPALKSCPLQFFRFQDGNKQILDLDFLG